MMRRFHMVIKAALIAVVIAPLCISLLDWITRDDIPGIGYFIVPAMMGGISALIFWFRKWLATGGTQ